MGFLIVCFVWMCFSPCVYEMDIRGLYAIDSLSSTQYMTSLLSLFF